MSEKRYSVFISSTYEDLKDERRAVQDEVISSGDFPVQMESFPAADEDQFDFIKALIDKCDYYILIIGGRYGTPADDGMSYTEKEYRYAVSTGVTVLAMLHGDPGSIPANKTEDSIVGRERLAAFRTEVGMGRLRQTWKTKDELKLAVQHALNHAKATKPGVGWIRGDAIASIDALEELNRVRNENEKYRDAIGDLEIELALPPIPSAGENIDIVLSLSDKHGKFGGDLTIRTTWIGVFPIFYENLNWGSGEWNGPDGYYINEGDSCVAIGSAIAEEVGFPGGIYRLNETILRRLASYYIEVRLMNEKMVGRPFPETAEKIARRHAINSRFGVFKLIEHEFAASKKKEEDGGDIPF